MREVRLARPEDVEDMVAIYSPYIENTAISFELSVPSVQEFGSRVETTLRKYPWLVVSEGTQVLGYAYGSLHRKRAAYQWSVEVSVYIGEAFHRQGLARLLYGRLFAVLRCQGFFQAYAGVVLPNVASEALHKRLGFAPVGVYRKVGFKRGAWRDVGWFSLELQPAAAEPVAPRWLPELVDSGELSPWLGAV